MKVGGSDWKFLTNHALVLSWIAQHQQSTALKIVGELVEGGYLDRRRKGRRNVYRVNSGIPLRHELEHQVPVGDLLDVIAPKRKRGAA